MRNFITFIRSLTGKEKCMFCLMLSATIVHAIVTLSIVLHTYNIH